MGLFSKKPGPSTACDADCGEPVDLSKKHVTINRNVETLRRGTVTVSDNEVTGQYHQHCAPKDGR